jgi:folate-dependent phosphoribosylglycinamide formyltransferase PurN
MTKTLLILGNDKIAGAALAQMKSSNSDIKILIDRSTNIKRVKILLQRRILSFSLILKMALCELIRKEKKPNKALEGISSNLDILEVINDFQPERLVLFRAGLIINKEILNTGIPVLNIHAATVPDFGGLGSIDKAIKSKAYNQSACLHVVTSRIDEGLVLDKEDYLLDPKISYFLNEDIAYKAANKLLFRAIKKNYFLSK